jgi:Amt family ammonium transporter
VHGVNGCWGLISLGIFANGDYGAGWNGVVRDSFVQAYGYDGVRGLLYGDPSQLWMQVINATVLASFAIPMSIIWFRLSNIITPIRSSAEDELMGLDASEMGIPGYPEFVLTPDRTVPEPAALVLGGGSPVTQPEVAVARA